MVCSHKKCLGKVTVAFFATTAAISRIINKKLDVIPAKAGMTPKGQAF